MIQPTDVSSLPEHSELKKEQILALLNRMEEIISAIKLLEKKHEAAINKVAPEFREGAQNLVHYKAFRQYDLSDLKNKLWYLGLSKLSKSERHILASLYTTRSLLQQYLRENVEPVKDPYLSIKMSEKVRKENTVRLLGDPRPGRRVRIMVTIPSSAATDKSWSDKIVAAGMDVARINCAHDNPAVWKAMIDNIREAGKKAGTHIKICMDLGGPKIRTGAIVPGAEVIKFKVHKDKVGRVVTPAKILLVAASQTELPKGAFLRIPDELFAIVKTGIVLRFRDAQNRKRKLKITAVAANGIEAELNKTSFVMSGTVLKHPAIEKPFVLGGIPAQAQSIDLEAGDLLVLHADPRPGKNAVRNADGEVVTPANISCTLPEILQYLKPGERVFFDDGQIEGLVKSANAKAAEIIIAYTKVGGATLSADKGINLPDSDLPISGLTEKDREDLAFVVEHADVVNLSFVNTADDVNQLLDALRGYGVPAGKLGIILKIETARGFKNLIEIILAGMQNYPLGVMIARGDLAVECGWEKLGLLQHEILRITEAAHVPNVLATQVMENLAKKGVPSRSEITDVTFGQRAECIMLNKGPHIVNAVDLVDRIFKKIRYYKDQKSTFLSIFDT